MCLKRIKEACIHLRTTSSLYSINVGCKMECFCLTVFIPLSYRELNNMGIWYRMGNVPRAQDCSHTPSTNNIQNVNSSGPAPVPATAMPKYVHCNSLSSISDRSASTHMSDSLCSVLILKNRMCALLRGKRKLGNVMLKGPYTPN